MATILVALAVTALAGLALRSMIREKKAGKLLSCGGDCSRCGRCCH